MLLHLGEDVVIKSHEIIAILDYNALYESKDIELFLDVQKKENNVRDLSEDHPKSIVITDKLVYISPLSSTTLKKRANDRAELEQGWYLK
ncbi:extracellular matrix regulator RemB [Fictibacillus gelatini]|uniref:extracellular matrix regulator RemB n=1 Tax=Fictibacillus gelatini TaxID=225985 RepID=UPI0003FAE993|nr:DUF370 domain-containing protein [Fictibacillus gelatini]